MPTLTVSKDTITPLGTVKERRNITTDGGVFKDPTLAAAKIGTLSLRTSDSVGSLTMNAGHGIANGNRLDVYWENGARYGCVVGTVAGNVVPITGGSGDNLPLLNAAITAMVPQLEPFVVTAAQMAALSVFVQGNAAAMYAVFRDGTTAVVAAIYVGPKDDGFSWDNTIGTTPFAANVVDVFLSHGHSAGSKQVIAAAYIN